MISTITLNPSLDKTIHITKLIPNDTNRVIKVEIDAGGKGINCSRMLKQLGAKTKIVTFLSGHNGSYIKLVLNNEGINYDHIETKRPTRTTTAIEESGDNPPTTFNEKGGPIEHSELVNFMEKVKDASRESSYIVVGGSIPMGITVDIYKALIQIAATSGAKAVLDADGEALVEGIRAKPFMVKPNLDEAERLLGEKFESRSDVGRAALKIQSMGVELVIISLGKQGAIAAYNGKIYDAVSPKVKTLSTVGSGDSLNAGVLFGLEQNLPFEECLKLGCACGAATAMSSGTEIGSKEHVDKLVEKIKVTILNPS